MKQEENELLKDLCARLPYGTKVNAADKYISTISSINIGITTLILLKDVSPVFGIDDVKPYLRPMPSMAEDEIKEFDEFCVIDEYAWRGGSMQGFINQAEIMQNGIDWLNARHFDYRGLIEKGLALEAPEGMYKI